jgi:hypothetical protein
MWSASGEIDVGEVVAFKMNTGRALVLVDLEAAKATHAVREYKALRDRCSGLPISHVSGGYRFRRESRACLDGLTARRYREGQDRRRLNGRPASIDAAQVRAMKAPGIGDCEGPQDRWASVYRVLGVR